MAFLARLPGYRRLSLARVCTGLQSFFRKGFSVSELQEGLDAYLDLVGKSWITKWGRAGNRADEVPERNAEPSTSGWLHPDSGEIAFARDVKLDAAVRG
jgi:hypothetical protein